jgi:hypothetical protein
VIPLSTFLGDRICCKVVVIPCVPRRKVGKEVSDRMDDPAKGVDDGSSAAWPGQLISYNFPHFSKSGVYVSGSEIPYVIYAKINDLYCTSLRTCTVNRHPFLFHSFQFCEYLFTHGYLELLKREFDGMNQLLDKTGKSGTS